jgi:hypothetical protein
MLFVAGAEKTTSCFAACCSKVCWIAIFTLPVFLTISEQKEHHTRGKQNETAHLQNIALIMEYDAKGVDRSETDGWKFTKYNVTDHQVLRPTSGGFSAVHHIKVYQRSP